jgi:fermentation-respiration switch protein FrsA (DUF1100 family)
MGNVNSILFRPPPPTLLHPNCRFFLTTALGNRIPACYFKRAGAGITLLYSHANAEDLGLMFGWLKCLSRRLNVNILAYDYTGYGESDGEPSEEACYADIDAAYDHLITFRNLDPKQIVIYGRSVGSGPATYLAAKLSEEGEQIGGLILECPFKSVFRVIADFGCTVLGDKFPNIDRISSVRCPTLIVHGTDDRTIPMTHGVGLYDEIPSDFRAKPYWVLGKGHNDLDYSSFDPLVVKLTDFLDEHLAEFKGRRASPSQVPTKIDKPLQLRATVSGGK